MWVENMYALEVEQQERVRKKETETSDDLGGG